VAARDLGRVNREQNLFLFSLRIAHARTSKFVFFVFCSFFSTFWTLGILEMSFMSLGKKQHVMLISFEPAFEVRSQKSWDRGWINVSALVQTSSVTS
jgi:hypothetical protein